MGGDMTTFYRLGPPDQYSRRALLDKSARFRIMKCPENWGHRKVAGTYGQLRIVIKTKTIDDLVWTIYNECVLQQRTVDIFRAEGLTGFDTSPILWRSSRKDFVPPEGPLSRLAISGWGGFAREDSGVKIREILPCCHHVIYDNVSAPTEIIDPSQWDGSDFFMVWPFPNKILITSRVVEVLRRHKLKGYELHLPLAQPNGFPTRCAGLLSWYFPRKRAKELAKGQDIV